MPAVGSLKRDGERQALVDHFERFRRSDRVFRAREGWARRWIVQDRDRDVASGFEIPERDHVQRVSLLSSGVRERRTLGRIGAKGTDVERCIYWLR